MEELTLSNQKLDLSPPVLEVARNMLGYEIIRRSDEGERRVRVVETEAYSEDDPASHSYNGPTPRSEVMFGPPGHWYVYKCYGIHSMLNVVCGAEGSGEAVLVRAVEPLVGEDLMVNRRGREGLDLTNGPGKLAEALDIHLGFDGTSVRSGSLVLRERRKAGEVFESPRVGIEEARTRFWRFYTSSSYVSDVSQNDLGRRRN